MTDPMTVHFVGAGPGAADLLTVRATRLLEAADVVLYPGTYLDPEVLAHCSPSASLVDTQKLDLDQIVAEIVAAHRAGHQVVRLVSGAVPHETQGDGRSTFMTHQPLAWRNVRDPHRGDDGTRFRGPGVHAVAGIGNPQRFFAMLRAQGLTPAEHPFDDHHAFTRKDLDYPGATAILMTQKDAVKCASFADERFWYLPIRAVVDPSLVALVEHRIRGFKAA